MGRAICVLLAASPILAAFCPFFAKKILQPVIEYYHLRRAETTITEMFLERFEEKYINRVGKPFFL